MFSVRPSRVRMSRELVEPTTVEQTGHGIISGHQSVSVEVHDRHITLVRLVLARWLNLAKTEVVAVVAKGKHYGIQQSIVSGVCLRNALRNSTAAFKHDLS